MCWVQSVDLRRILCVMNVFWRMVFTHDIRQRLCHDKIERCLRNLFLWKTVGAKVASLKRYLDEFKEIWLLFATNSQRIKIDRAEKVWRVQALHKLLEWEFHIILSIFKVLSSRQNLCAVDHIKHWHRLWIIIAFTFYLLDIDSTYPFIYLLYSEHEAKLPQVKLVLV